MKKQPKLGSTSLLNLRLQVRCLTSFLSTSPAPSAARFLLTRSAAAFAKSSCAEHASTQSRTPTKLALVAKSPTSTILQFQKTALQTRLLTSLRWTTVAVWTQSLRMARPTRWRPFLHTCEMTVPLTGTAHAAESNAKPNRTTINTSKLSAKNLP